MTGVGFESFHILHLVGSSDTRVKFDDINAYNTGLRRRCSSWLLALGSWLTSHVNPAESFHLDSSWQSRDEIAKEPVRLK